MLGIVIDDSKAMRKILRKFLEDLNFSVLEAGNGREALEVIGSADSVPELALIDWNMPEMNGLEFVVEARKNPEWRSMTLVMVTTESEHSQIVRALASGAHEYVIKPFTKDGMIDKLALLGLVPVGVLS
jgi:two-component system, chemotaxis family, chemotaxis protein CheY